MSVAETALREVMQISAESVDSRENMRGKPCAGSAFLEIVGNFEFCREPCQNAYVLSQASVNIPCKKEYTMKPSLRIPQSTRTGNQCKNILNNVIDQTLCLQIAYQEFVIDVENNPRHVGQHRSFCKG